MDTYRHLLAAESSITVEIDSQCDGDHALDADVNTAASGALAGNSATSGMNYLNNPIDYKVYAQSIRQVLDDPELPSPITMGIIGKLGSGKDRLIKNILYEKFGACSTRCTQLNDSFEPRHIRWVYEIGRCYFSVRGCLFALFLTYVIITSLSSYGLVVSVFGTDLATRGNQSGMFGKILVGASNPVAIVAIGVSVSLLMLLLMIGIISVCVTLCTGDSAFSLSETFHHAYLFIVMVLCQVPSIVPFDEDEPVQFIPVCFNAWVYAATDNLLATIVQSIFHKTERLFGKWKMRIHRILTPILLHEHDFGVGDGTLLEPPLTEFPAEEERPNRCCPCKVKEELTVVVSTSRWRRYVPYPILITIVLIIFTLSIVIIVVVIAKEGVTSFSAADRAIEAVAGGFIGITLLSQLQNIYAVVKSFCVSKAAKIANLSKSTKSSVISHDLGFMSEVKKEISKTMGFIRVMEQLYGKRFRILLIIEDLDECTSAKIAEIFEALKLLLNDSGNPIISIISVDPEPVIKALTNSKGGRNGFLELQKLCDMRFCMPRISQHDVSRVMAMKAQHLKASDAARSLTLLQQEKSSRKYRQEKLKFLASTDMEDMSGWLKASQISRPQLPGCQLALNKQQGIQLAAGHRVNLSVNHQLPSLASGSQSTTDEQIEAFLSSSKEFRKIFNNKPKQDTIYTDEVRHLIEGRHNVIGRVNNDYEWEKYLKVNPSLNSDLPDLLEKPKGLRKALTSLALREVKENTGILHQNFANVSQLFYTVHLSMACLATKLRIHLHKRNDYDQVITLRWISVTCTELTRWLILCEQWPYRMSWIIHSIVNENLSHRGNEVENNDEENQLCQHYLSVRQSLTVIPEWEQLIQMDDLEQPFQTALNQFDQISTASVIKYLPLTFNVNRNIHDQIEEYISLKQTQGNIIASGS